VRLLKALDRNRRVTAVPFQKTGIPASVGLTLQECEASACVIVPLCTENALRFSARLDDGSPEVRFECSALTRIAQAPNR
jgi:hypothetical protein